MKKLFWLIVLLWTWYIISVFLAPTFSDKIWDLFWIKIINEEIRTKIWDLNKISTNIPNSKELQEWYGDAIKKAWDFKDTVIYWIDKTKNTIDDVRSTLSWAEDTYNKAKDTIKDTMETVDKLKKTFSDVEKMWTAIKESVNTWTIK